MSMYEFGPFQLRIEELLLTRSGNPIALGPKVVETLLALVEHPGEILSKNRLMDRIWPAGFVEEANLSQNIHVLRKTFRQYGTADPIETVPRRGYRFALPVRRLAINSQSFKPQVKHGPSRRIVAAISGAVFAATAVVLVASYGLGHRGAGAISENGSQLYQIGTYYWNLRTRDGVRRSLTYFAQVIDADPRSARGYAALADANVTMGDYCYGTHKPAVYFARALSYAEKALALDPNSADAHAALGFLALDRRDMRTAVVELQRAIALDRSYAPAQEWYGIALVRSGRLREGIVHLRLASELDPLSVATIAWLGSAAYRDGRYGDAILYSREALELSPRRADVLATVGEAYEALGDINHAIAAYKRYAALNPYHRAEAAALLAHALGHSRSSAPGGMNGNARQIERHARSTATYA